MALGAAFVLTACLDLGGSWDTTSATSATTTALRHGYRPQCMFGATNVTAYLRAPGAPPLRGGDTGRVELVTRWPTAAEVGDTFVLRDSGSTLAIGRVLELLDG